MWLRVKEKIVEKINKWNNNFLSFAGKVQVCQKILYSYSIYFTSSWLFKRNQFGIIQKMIRDYLVKCFHHRCQIKFEVYPNISQFNWGAWSAWGAWSVWPVWVFDQLGQLLLCWTFVQINFVCMLGPCQSLFCCLVCAMRVRLWHVCCSALSNMKARVSC